MMRSSWVAGSALAVIGAFFFALQILWMLHVEPAWLPYPVHAIAAVIAGGAMAKAAPPRSIREPLFGGVLAIVILAAITFLLPKAFTLTAARSDHRWVLLPILAVVSGLGSVGGAWLFADGKTRELAIGVVAALVMPCMIQLGGRLGYTLGVPVSSMAVAIELAILGFLTGAIVQSIVTIRAVRTIAIGAAVFVIFGVITQLAKGKAFDLSGVLALIPIVTAALGARTAKPATAS